jgi:hypothetical protein
MKTATNAALVLPMNGPHRRSMHDSAPQVSESIDLTALLLTRHNFLTIQYDILDAHPSRKFQHSVLELVTGFRKRRTEICGSCFGPYAPLVSLRSGQIRLVPVVSGIDGSYRLQNAGGGSDACSLCSRTARCVSCAVASFFHGLSRYPLAHAPARRSLPRPRFPSRIRGYAALLRQLHRPQRQHRDCDVSRQLESRRRQLSCRDCSPSNLFQPFANHNGGQIRFGPMVTAHRNG